ncbi:hypothetical protein AB0C96_05685 [Streptomyces sp. NPDC048506]|uniref:hypothetical protein n=1 Tax=Streptomyces sp. NPDC048506 TaxID=3155028 RepID=UPI00342358A6
MTQSSALEQLMGRARGPMDVKPLGASLEAWAGWLLSDPDVNGVNSFAHAFQKENGALEPNERLIPLQFFVTGGAYDFDNLSVKDAAVAMRIRGPIAQKTHNAPEGATIRFGIERDGAGCPGVQVDSICFVRPLSPLTCGDGALLRSGRPVGSARSGVVRRVVRVWRQGPSFSS